jgi:peptidoglycan/LPS O-acetylase OafA/YrhL
MTLSGYLFSKLVADKSIVYSNFIWNRLLRLFPLFLLVVILRGAHIYFLVGGASDQALMAEYYRALIAGFVLPTWPNGGWSIATELHFYIAFPLLLYLRNKDARLLLLALAAFVGIRYYIHSITGEVQSLSYWTIVGRIDQFTLGILAFHYRAHVQRRHLLAVLTFLAFTAYYHWFNLNGGWQDFLGYPSTAPVWVFQPSVEGLAAAILIAWYDTSFKFAGGGLSKLIGRIGEYSYSIYLLHVFVVYRAAEFIHRNILDISSFTPALLASLPVFVALLPISFLTMRFIELPALRYRKNYLASKPISTFAGTAISANSRQ